jgi:malonyl-CoA O-methyltransferase
MMPPHILRAAYDREAATYDERFVAQQTPKIQALAAALPPIPPGPVVDLGAGTGLVSRITGRAMLAVDFSERMLALGPKPAVVGDLRALPLASDTFALAWCVTAIIGVDQVHAVLAEVARVLRPGGLLALSMLAHEPRSRIEAALISHQFELLETLQIAPDVGWICRR